VVYEDLGALDNVNGAAVAAETVVYPIRCIIYYD
jgi:hypothetical protein